MVPHSSTEMCTLGVSTEEAPVVQSRSIDLPLPVAMDSLPDELEGRRLSQMSYLLILSMLLPLRASLVYKTENTLAIQPTSR